ncbi:MAG TPA: hypothetical protein VLL25_04700 [Acidimicrobiales bacterium]|nr:hypothetical protein [Acidimicrobiales bacterium]
MDSGRTAMLAPMLRQLAEAARVQRRQLVIDAAERQFYLGVEAAAQGLLHPEVAAGRNPDWLEREKPEFREGYLTMLADLTTAISAETLPLAFRLPRYEERASRP